jgi:hypothetical protein
VYEWAGAVVPYRAERQAYLRLTYREQRRCVRAILLRPIRIAAEGSRWVAFVPHHGAGEFFTGARFHSFPRFASYDMDGLVILEVIDSGPVRSVACGEIDVAEIRRPGMNNSSNPQDELGSVMPAVTGACRSPSRIQSLGEEKDRF